jgi:hypothetical protein
MTQKLWIFGDSYADRNYWRDDGSFDISWVRELEKHYDVSNFATSGSGPDFAMKQLIDNINYNGADNLSDIIVIFVIPEISRINFSFLPPNHQLVPLGMLNPNLNDKGLELIRPYKKYENFIKDVFKYYITTSTYLDTELAKIVGWVFLQSHLFKKMLVWPTDEKMPAVKQIASDNFLYIDTPIVEIEDDNHGYGYDSRLNHLSQANHHIMLEQLIQWIEHNDPIDLTKFTVVNTKKQLY